VTQRVPVRHFLIYPILQSINVNDSNCVHRVFVCRQRHGKPKRPIHQVHLQRLHFIIHLAPRLVHHLPLPSSLHLFASLYALYVDMYVNASILSLPI
jgi:hypothetical protein